MKKNVLIVSSSPRGGGNSDLLCDEFAKEAQNAGHTVEKIALRDRRINYCNACGDCYAGKECPQKDDMPGILDSMAIILKKSIRGMEIYSESIIIQ